MKRLKSLKTRIEFQEVFSNSSRVSDRVLSLYIRNEEDGGREEGKRSKNHGKSSDSRGSEREGSRGREVDCRLGLVVPKRVIRKAVSRNYAKRFIRAEICQALKGLEGKDFRLDLIVRVNAYFDRGSRPDVFGLFNRLVRRMYKC